ncbi:hypothetical protein OV208_05470 [Corallococcus sp. bb12-1]|uniref:hypothetical protein n=1 Tax=Corallococcus sp. bb12-1 TaxID=2996784 RepID=UPI002270EFEC|nr:hypothetical protein [Corallococcus sp. bb12-1]MCY1040766.1 hypothetical protein [Corallococcus sp. bb12-1]
MVASSWLAKAVGSPTLPAARWALAGSSTSGQASGFATEHEQRVLQPAIHQALLQPQVVALRLHPHGVERGAQVAGVGGRESPLAGSDSLALARPGSPGAGCVL